MNIVIKLCDEYIKSIQLICGWLCELKWYYAAQSDCEWLFAACIFHVSAFNFDVFSSGSINGSPFFAFVQKKKCNIRKCAVFFPYIQYSIGHKTVDFNGHIPKATKNKGNGWAAHKLTVINCMLGDLGKERTRGKAKKTHLHTLCRDVCALHKLQTASERENKFSGMANVSYYHMIIWVGYICAATAMASIPFDLIQSSCLWAVHNCISNHYFERAVQVDYTFSCNRAIDHARSLVILKTHIHHFVLSLFTNYRRVDGFFVRQTSSESEKKKNRKCNKFSDVYVVPLHSFIILCIAEPV